jgi:hypothetical protein
VKLTHLNVVSPCRPLSMASYAWLTASLNLDMGNYERFLALS